MPFLDQQKRKVVGQIPMTPQAHCGANEAGPLFYHRDENLLNLGFNYRPNPSLQYSGVDLPEEIGSVGTQLLVPLFEKQVPAALSATPAALLTTAM